MISHGSLWLSEYECAENVSLPINFTLDHKAQVRSPPRINLVNFFAAFPRDASLSLGWLTRSKQGSWCTCVTPTCTVNIKALSRRPDSHRRFNAREKPGDTAAATLSNHAGLRSYSSCESHLTHSTAPEHNQEKQC